MKRLMELAGFLAAHGMWSFDEDGALTPMAGYEMPDGSRGLVRFVDESLEAGVQSGRRFMEGNLAGAAMAVMVSDGSYVAEGAGMDALIVDGRQYGDEAGALTIAVPYRAATEAAPFAILFPELLQFDAVGETFDLLEVFFGGVNSHGPAAEFWAGHAQFGREKGAA